MEVKDMASMGGKARWEGKTDKQKSDHAKAMVNARELKKLSTPKRVAKRKKV